MPEPVLPAPLSYVEPASDPARSQTVPEPLRQAAARVLARDGRDLHLQPWQVAYLVATSEGREGVVPLGCGVGKGWLQERLDEAARADTDPAER